MVALPHVLCLAIFAIFLLLFLAGARFVPLLLVFIDLSVINVLSAAARCLAVTISSLNEVLVSLSTTIFRLRQTLTYAMVLKVEIGLARHRRHLLFKGELLHRSLLRRLLFGFTALALFLQPPLLR